ncbi:GH23387 [Drosophila grimshawi]|uniref:GH23387 n=1 Tax=Drosophila grimshawi TaxID=7222 RepID=B4K3P3_DROGR|nr:GH23387 [Drosophila grimshawi]
MKTVLLAEYDYIEKTQGQLQTATVEEKIHNITKKILNVYEQLQLLKKDSTEGEANKEEVPFERQSIDEQKLETKKNKQAEKDAEQKAQKGEVSEVVAEKVSEEKTPESKKPGVKESEAEAQKAKILEQPVS